MIGESQTQRVEPRAVSALTPLSAASEQEQERATVAVPALRGDAVLRRALGVGDALAACLAVVLTTALVDPGAVRVRPEIALVAPLAVVIAKVLGLYDRDQYRLRKATIDEAPSLIHLALVLALTVWLGERALLHGTLDRSQVLAIAGLGFALAFVARAATRAIVLAVSEPERCLLVGSDADAARAAARMASPQVNAVLIGRIALEPVPRGWTGGGKLPPGRPGGEDHPAAADAAGLASAIEACGAQRVIIAPDGHDDELVLRCIRLLATRGIKVSVLPRLLEVMGSSSVYDEVDGITLLGVREFGLSKSSQLLKRAIDIVGAGAGLVGLAPLFGLVAVAIRVDSAGSPLFAQRRIGRRGQPFRMLKFRSMVAGADELKGGLRELNQVEGGLFKVEGDPRVTRVGRLLRRTSLDELPQLVNVLRGDMSLVGPRPLVEDEDALVVGWERRRLTIKPGMTGLWQIFGSSRIPLPEMVKLDYIYGANWSIWLDLKILLRTVAYVVSRRGV